MNDKYLTIAEAVKYTKTSRSTINRWTQKGLPKIRANKVLIKKDDLDDYLERRKITRLI